MLKKVSLWGPESVGSEQNLWGQNLWGQSKLNLNFNLWGLNFNLWGQSKLYFQTCNLWGQSKLYFQTCGGLPIFAGNIRLPVSASISFLKRSLPIAKPLLVPFRISASKAPSTWALNNAL